MRRAIAGPRPSLGLAISIYLTWVHYADVAPVCTGIGDCEKVQTSDYAELAGIPVAVLGIVGYLAILASLRRARGGDRPPRIHRRGLQRLPHLGGAVRDRATCQWCVASAVASVAIAVLATLLALRAPLHHRPLS